MSSRDLESRVCAYFDNLANAIPSQFYVSADRGGVSNDDCYFREDRDQKSRTKKASNKNKLQRSRYDPDNWRCTSDVLLQTASTQFRNPPQKKPKNLARQQFVANGQPSKNVSDPMELSREDLRKRLHEKIAALQQQQQEKKTKKYTREEIKTFREMKRSQRVQNNVSKEQKRSPSRSIGENVETDFIFNRVVARGTPSQEKRKEEELEESGVIVGKKRRMIEALKVADRKEKDRADWTATKREEAETKDALDNAMLKACGERVFDDPKRLRKALKVREKKVEKSSRNWNERKKAVEESQNIASKKRAQNVRNRTSLIEAKKR